MSKIRQYKSIKKKKDGLSYHTTHEMHSFDRKIWIKYFKSVKDFYQALESTLNPANGSNYITNQHVATIS